MRLVVVALLAGILATGGFLALNPQEATQSQRDQDQIDEIGGGTVTYSSALEPGERFLKQGPLPDHLANPYQPDPAEEEPGDGHDDELLILQRRNTDHSWWERPLTGYVEIKGVHGTATQPICICDTEYVMSNESGIVGGVYLHVRDSSHILFDNVTMYGAKLYLDNSHHITISRSQFVSSHIDGLDASDVLVWDNDFYTAEGPLTAVESDPIYEEPTGIHDCWPNPTCLWSGLVPIIANRWTVKWNHFDSGGPAGAGFGFGLQNFHIEHNTILNSMTTKAGHGGHNVVKWNLIRGFGFGGIDIAGDTCLVENNSVILAFAIHRSEVILQQPGVRVLNACATRIANNDFVGYGVQLDGVPPLTAARGGSPALRNNAGLVTADDNHWGTIHDPTVPPGRWILTGQGAQTTLSQWFVQPVHDVTPIVYGLNHQDVDRWLDETPKRLDEMPAHAAAWAEEQVPFG